MQYREWNFDGLVGLTHHYGGLSFGNIASMHHAKALSHPKEAALQGLEKMKTLMELGIPQGILPPHERPFIPILRSLGYIGKDHEILVKASKEAPGVLSACSSAAAMWTANAATITPSCDTKDQKTHITPANLQNKFHRSFEPPFTAEILKIIFSNEEYFKHHSPLPSHEKFGDEGAANHSRICNRYGESGLNIFVYGRDGYSETENQIFKFPARQTLLASQAIAQQHTLDQTNAIFVKQDPECINAGAFHNDVVAVGNEYVFLYHEKAYLEKEHFIQGLKQKFKKLSNNPLCLIEVSEKYIDLKTAISSYLFNSQLITTQIGQMTLICPADCQQFQSVVDYINNIIQDPTNPITQVQYLPLRESMNNGGGPACLRLRVVLSDKEAASINPSFILTPERYVNLRQWIQKHYRESLSVPDLADPNFLDECRRALDDLTQILNIGSVYSFQK
jgi:succinylarginine dihydrolase